MQTIHREYQAIFSQKNRRNAAFCQSMGLEVFSIQRVLLENEDKTRIVFKSRSIELQSSTKGTHLVTFVWAKKREKKDILYFFIFKYLVSDILD